MVNQMASIHMAPGNTKIKEAYYRFNKGRCTFGDRCKFDHRCLICSKFSHGAHNCRCGTGGSSGSGNHKSDNYEKNDKHDRSDSHRTKQFNHGSDHKGQKS